MLEVGMIAPDMECQDHEGKSIRLSQLWAQGTMLLYFYPKDDTETCTKQACAFQEQIDDFSELGCRVVGISPDDATSHQKFREKYGLSFRLLCDHEHRIAEAYQVWREKTLYGRTYMGVIRSSFLISEQGVLIGVFDAVRLKGHITELLSLLAQSQGAAVAKAPSIKTPAKGARTLAAAKQTHKEKSPKASGRTARKG